ncbi:MAG: HTH domain-containing protein [Nanoarchaeota archaeon]
MSQIDIILLLRRHSPKKFTAQEISEYIGISPNSVYNNLKSLREECERMVKNNKEPPLKFEIEVRENKKGYEKVYWQGD